MRSFGDWLRGGGNGSEEATKLLAVAEALGAKWPVSSGLHADYEAAINTELGEQDRGLALNALNRLSDYP